MSRASVNVSVENLLSFFAGLRVTDLERDVTSGPHTLLAPIDDAFKRLPWTLSQLFGDEDLFEMRFNLFEYLVCAGHHRADGPPTIVSTLEGGIVTLGDRVVIGEHGRARVLGSARIGMLLMHVLSDCVFPYVPVVTDPGAPSCASRAGFRA